MQANNKNTRPDSVCQFAKQRRKGEKAGREREREGRFSESEQFQWARLKQGFVICVTIHSIKFII